MKFLPTLLLCACGIGSLHAAPVLFALRGDAFGVPRDLVRIDVGAASATALVSLDDGSFSFAGGLAESAPGVFTGLRTDSFGSAELVSYTTAGAVTSLSPLDPGFYGGLALLAGAPHAIRNDLNGDSWFGALPGSGLLLGQGFTGGLAYRPEDGLFYAISNDPFGNSSLQSIAAGVASVLPISLGSGFTGGLAWDSASGFFYAISSDPFANSALYRFNLADSSPVKLFDLDQGYLFASLTSSSTAPAPVPEPASLALAAAGLTVLALVRRRR